MYQKDKSSEPNVKFTQVSNHCKRVLEAAEAAKFAYAHKTEVLSVPINSALRTFGKLAIVFSAKVNMKTFLRTLRTLWETVFPSITTLKLHISVTQKMIKKVIMNID